MKIREITTHILCGKYVFVRVWGDDGTFGIGECSPMAAKAMVGLVDFLRPLLLGRNAFDIEPLCFAMFTGGYKTGQGLLQFAISGIDIALHDLKGKALQVPVYELLGGAYRKEFEVFNSLWRWDLPPEKEVDRFVQAVGQGYPAVKMHLDRRWGFDARPEETIDIVRTIRKEVGDQFGILIDVNNAYSLPTALRVGRELEALGVSHFEEPLAAYDYQGYAQLQAALDMPIAAGEQEYTRWQYMNLISEAKVDILQPDVIKTGGFTESVKIGDLAQMYGKPIVTHNAYPTVNTVAQMHYWAATQACYPRQEYVTEPHPLRDEYPLFPNLPIPENGRIKLGEGPGLGLELDEKMLKRCEEITSDTPILHH